MSRHWSDAYANAAGLADALDTLSVPIITNAANALRMANKLRETMGCDLSTHKLRTTTGEWTLAELADLLDAHADRMAADGRYEAFVLLTDASAALRELAEREDTSVVTGEFRALRSECIAGVAITEYEGDDTARYVAIGHGQSDQPPELVRVWAADPDDVDDEEWDATNPDKLDGQLQP